MARTNQQLTQSEVDAYQTFCTEHRIACDESEGARANGNLIGEYIAITWGEDITPATLAVALEKLRDRIVFYTPARAEYVKIADEDAARASALNDWLQSPGNTSLVRDSDEGFRNQTILLAELRGREITPKTIQDAVGRAGFKRGLHYVPTPRRVDPRQHAPSGSFMPQSETNLSSGDHAKRTADAAAASAGRPAPMSGTDYRELAEAIKGPTHSKTEQIQKMFVTEGGTISWEQTYFSRRRAAGLF